MSENYRVNPNPDEAIRGKILQLLRINDESTKGNYHIIEDYEVPHGTASRDIEFGILQSKVYNERNGNKSRRSDLIVDTYDLFVLPSVEHSGLEALGADNTYTTLELQDSSDLKLDDLLQDHNIISSTFVGKDRVHGEFKTVRVQTWNPRVSEALDPSFGDLLKRTTKLVVDSVEADPTGDAIIDIQKEQLGYDKYLRTVVESPNDVDISTTRSLVAIENSEVVTEKLIVAKDFVVPSPTITTVESKLEPFTGYKNIWTNSYLKDPWPILVSYEEESVTGLKVTVTREIVDSVSPADTPTIGRTITHEHVGKNKYVKTTREIFNGVGGITSIKQKEYHHVEYDFPSYLDTTPFLSLNLGGGVIFNSYANPNLSSTHRFKIPCRFEITYHTVFPAPSDIFQFKTIDFEVHGYQWNVAGVLNTPLDLNFQNIITDEHNISVWIYYGGINSLATVTIPKSLPTTTQYKSYMLAGNKEALILEEVSEWKFNIWRRVKVFMPFPNLIEGSFTGTPDGVFTTPP